MIEEIIRIGIYLVSFVLCFYTLSALDLQKLLRKGKTVQAQILLLLLAMALAYLVAQFILNMRIVL